MDWQAFTSFFKPYKAVEDSIREENGKQDLHKVRVAIRRSLFWTIICLALAYLTDYLLVVLNIKLTYSPLFPVVCFITSAMLILWALLGRLGWNIQTWDGDSLPERINLMWFRMLNITGTYLLFLGIFSSII